jgi:ribosomal protein L11 methyltransferase
VDAVDIEPVAIQVARRNVERNGVVDIVRVELGSVGPGEPFQEEYAPVVANILAQVFVDLASCLAKAVRAGGMLILGDIINFREVAVREAFAGLGLRVCRRDEMEGWVMLALRKPDV